MKYANKRALETFYSIDGAGGGLLHQKVFQPVDFDTQKYLPFSTNFKNETT